MTYWRHQRHPQPMNKPYPPHIPLHCPRHTDTECNIPRQEHVSLQYLNTAISLEFFCNSLNSQNNNTILTRMFEDVAYLSLYYYSLSITLAYAAGPVGEGVFPVNTKHCNNVCTMFDVGPAFVCSRRPTSALAMVQLIEFIIYTNIQYNPSGIF